MMRAAQSLAISDIKRRAAVFQFNDVVGKQTLDRRASHAAIPRCIAELTTAASPSDNG